MEIDGFHEILKNNKNFENFKNDFQENFLRESFQICIEEQKTFTIRPPKINISHSRTDSDFLTLSLYKSLRNLMKICIFRSIKMYQKMKICKMFIQILKEHAKPHLGVVSDSPRTLWLLRSHLGNPIPGTIRNHPRMGFCMRFQKNHILFAHLHFLML